MFSILHEVQIQLALLVAVLVVLTIRFVIRQIWAQKKVNAAYARLTKARTKLENAEFEEVCFQGYMVNVADLEEIIIPSLSAKFNKAVEQRDSIRFI
jgi:nucleoside-triphosphatase THEP1